MSLEKFLRQTAVQSCCYTVQVWDYSEPALPSAAKTVNHAKFSLIMEFGFRGEWHGKKKHLKRLKEWKSRIPIWIKALPFFVVSDKTVFFRSKSFLPIQYLARHAFPGSFWEEWALCSKPLCKLTAEYIVQLFLQILWDRIVRFLELFGLLSRFRNYF